MWKNYKTNFSTYSSTYSYVNVTINVIYQQKPKLKVKKRKI